jgi:hypothetical protein
MAEERWLCTVSNRSRHFQRMMYRQSLKPGTVLQHLEVPSAGER